VCGLFVRVKTIKWVVGKFMCLSKALFARLERKGRDEFVGMRLKDKMREIFQFFWARVFGENDID